MMTNLTTDDCKAKLVELYPFTTQKSWKRTKKYLNAQKHWERIFVCTDPAQARTVLLEERAGLLFEVSASAPGPALHPLPFGLVCIHPDAELTRSLFGATGKEVLSVPYASVHASEKAFLLVLECTIDWNAPEHARSTYDAAKEIDFQGFVSRCTVQGIDLLGSYLAYMAYQLDHFAGIDEEQFPDIALHEYDDSLADMLVVLQRIRAGYTAAAWAAPLNEHARLAVIQELDALKAVGLQTFDADDEDAQDAFDCIKSARKALGPR